jgi:[calcium/calmodulin-dependent protein kinase] kinase
MVRLCFDTRLHKKVAMKVMNKRKLKRLFIGKNKSAYKLVECEIAVMKKVCHKNVVQLYEIIDDPSYNKLYLVMQYIPGGDLLHRIKKEGKIPTERCWKYFRGLIAGLEYCHDVAGIIHRDIKPENLLLDLKDNLYISDFGISFMIENGSDEAKATIGSAYFMAPEICKGANYKGRQTDIWAAGVTLYYMATGKLPFQGASKSLLIQEILSAEYFFGITK